MEVAQTSGELSSGTVLGSVLGVKTNLEASNSRRGEDEPWSAIEGAVSLIV